MITRPNPKTEALVSDVVVVLLDFTKAIVRVERRKTYGEWAEEIIAVVTEFYAEQAEADVEREVRPNGLEQSGTRADGQSFRDDYRVALPHPARSEPTEEQVDAALHAYWGGNATEYGSREGMRAALKAAFTGQEKS